MAAHPGNRKAKKPNRQRASADTAAKREARLARQRERERLAERRRRMQRVRTAAIGAVVVAVLAFGVWMLTRPEPELAGVTRPPSDGRGHVEGATFDSPTPTSGPHDPQAPRCGSYSEPIDPSLAVHGLEHGAVVLWYDAARPELADQLDEATANFDSHVLISANASLEEPIVATAWNRRKAYDAGDDPEITEFVETYRRRGPERQPCDR